MSTTTNTTSQRLDRVYWKQFWHRTQYTAVHLIYRPIGPITIAHFSTPKTLCGLEVEESSARYESEQGPFGGKRCKICDRKRARQEMQG